jgi:hypothetical protein
MDTLQHASTFHETLPCGLRRIPSWVCVYPCSSSEVFSPATQLCICCVLLKVLPQVVCITSPSSLWSLCLACRLMPGVACAERLFVGQCCANGYRVSTAVVVFGLAVQQANKLRELSVSCFLCDAW